MFLTTDRVSLRCIDYVQIQAQRRQHLEIGGKTDGTLATLDPVQGYARDPSRLCCRCGINTQGLSLGSYFIAQANGYFLGGRQDRKSTRLNSSHVRNSYAVFCLK